MRVVSLLLSRCECAYLQLAMGMGSGTKGPNRQVAHAMRQMLSEHMVCTLMLLLLGSRGKCCLDE